MYFHYSIILSNFKWLPSNSTNSSFPSANHLPPSKPMRCLLLSHTRHLLLAPPPGSSVLLPSVPACSCPDLLTPTSLPPSEHLTKLLVLLLIRSILVTTNQKLKMFISSTSCSCWASSCLLLSVSLNHTTQRWRPSGVRTAAVMGWCAMHCTAHRLRSGCVLVDWADSQLPPLWLLRHTHMSKHSVCVCVKAISTISITINAIFTARPNGQPVCRFMSVALF